MVSTVKIVTMLSIQRPICRWKKQSIENAGVTFVKGANKINEFF